MQSALPDALKTPIRPSGPTPTMAMFGTARPGHGVETRRAGGGSVRREHAEERRLRWRSPTSRSPPPRAHRLRGTPPRPATCTANVSPGPTGVRRPPNAVAGVAHTMRGERNEPAGARRLHCRRSTCWFAGDGGLPDRRRHDTGRSGEEPEVLDGSTAEHFRRSTAEPAVDQAGVVVAEVDVERHAIPPARARRATGAARSGRRGRWRRARSAGPPCRGRCRRRRCSNWFDRTRRTS